MRFCPGKGPNCSCRDIAPVKNSPSEVTVGFFAFFIVFAKRLTLVLLCSWGRRHGGGADGGTGSGAFYPPEDVRQHSDISKKTNPASKQRGLQAAAELLRHGASVSLHAQGLFLELWKSKLTPPTLALLGGFWTDLCSLMLTTVPAPQAQGSSRRINISSIKAALHNTVVG